jgi:hypothetical protein
VSDFVPSAEIVTRNNGLNIGSVNICDSLGFFCFVCAILFFLIVVVYTIILTPDYQKINQFITKIGVDFQWVIMRSP